MTLDQKTKDLIAYSMVAFSNTISVIACLSIIFLYYKAKELRVYAFKLVVILATLDMLKSLTMIIPTYSSDSQDVSCAFQACAYQFFTVGGFLLTLLMAVSLYLCIIRNFQDIERYSKVFFACIFLASVCATVPVFVFRIWGRVNYWCWVSKEYTMFRILIFYGPLWVENSLNVYLYYQVVSKLKDENFEIYRLRFYPVILVVCYLPATVARVLEAFGVGVPLFLVLLTGFFDGILGLVNCMAYGFTKHVKNYVRRMVAKRKYRWSNELENLNSH